VVPVGEDEFLVRTLARAGVNTGRLVRLRSVGTSATVVLVTADGEPSFLHCPGANAGLRPEHFSTPLFERCRILHFGGALLLPGSLQR